MPRFSNEHHSESHRGCEGLRGTAVKVQPQLHGVLNTKSTLSDGRVVWWEEEDMGWEKRSLKANNSSRGL